MSLLSLWAVRAGGGAAPAPAPARVFLLLYRHSRPIRTARRTTAAAPMAMPAISPGASEGEEDEYAGAEEEVGLVALVGMEEGETEEGTKAEGAAVADVPDGTAVEATPPAVRLT